MNDPENFISRWSRRKQEAASEDAEPKKARSEGARSIAVGRRNQTEVCGNSSASSGIRYQQPAADRIDQRGNRHNGVHADRRAGDAEACGASSRYGRPTRLSGTLWGSTRTIGTQPGLTGFPGFGDLDPNLDVRRMVSELFGETPRQDTQPESEADRVADSSALPTDNSPDAADPPQATLAAA